MNQKLIQITAEYIANHPEDKDVVKALIGIVRPLEEGNDRKTYTKRESLKLENGNRPWTIEQDVTVDLMRRQGASWRKISKTVGRTNRACSQRWYIVIHPKQITQGV